MLFYGKVWKFGDNIDTDMIIPGRYLDILNPKEFSKYCMEGVCHDFSKKISPGDIIVGGKNLDEFIAFEK
ncbi:MAG: hypothetical protein GX764_06525, partial [Firmicutes bacterium]|nr:hypothetical protein [Bacillota bacterium]